MALFLVFLLLPLWWPVVFFGQVAGLGQTARVQRGPSEAARCASNGTVLLPASSFPSPLFCAGVHHITEGQGWEVLGA